jgi:hypothetical protein
MWRMALDPGDLDLPPGYWMDESDPDVIVVRDDQGRPAAFFTQFTITRAGIESAAWFDHERSSSIQRTA